jgi:hypothetical protein
MALQPGTTPQPLRQCRAAEVALLDRFGVSSSLRECRGWLLLIITLDTRVDKCKTYPSELGGSTHVTLYA